MKFVKRISLFFIYPVLMFLIGFYAGIKFHDFFYPGKPIVISENKVPSLEVEVAVPSPAILDADSVYIVEEVDLRTQTSETFERSVPEKFLGMNRKEFLEAMEEFELSPPLSELERGFVSLSVEAFSGSEVRVKMNYHYKEPPKSFFIRAENHYLVVYNEADETVYMHTAILLEELPDELQQRVIQTIYMEDEKTLYNFLESYSS